MNNDQRDTTNPKDIFVIGSYISGLTIQVPRFPYEGETLIGNNFDWDIGGKGLNQAIAASRLGANVMVTLNYGDDVFGDLLENKIAKENLNREGCTRNANTNSGIGFVTLTDRGENTIIIDPGANALTTSLYLSSYKQYLENSKLLLAQLELPLETVEYAFSQVNANRTIRMLNPAPAVKLPDTLLESIDVITPNETEAKIILGYSPDQKIPLRALTDTLFEKGIGNVVVTLGGKGVALRDEDGYDEIAAITVEAVDPTGAGDSFNGCLANCLINGMGFREAVKIAMVAGAYCTQFRGVSAGLPRRKQLEKLLKDPHKE